VELPCIQGALVNSPYSVRRLRPKRGFTLLELLVVIAISAALLGAMLPAISRARRLAQSTGCESNLRTLWTACQQYTLDYNGSYPFGFVFNQQNANGRPAAGDTRCISWFSSFDKYLTSGTNEIYPLDGVTQFIDGSTRRVFHAAFKCPAVPATFLQKVHYYQHPVVMPHMTLEKGRRPAFQPSLTFPAKINQVYSNTALVWDTPLWTGAGPDAPSMFWISSQTPSGLAAPVSYIDYSDSPLLAWPEYPERRFRSPGADRFAISSNPLKNPAGPIAWASDAYLASQNPQIPTMNADVGNTALVSMFGAPRFRHTNGGCNVLFADGSVQTLFLKPNHKISFGVTGAANYIDSDFKRYMLMIKWPNNGIYDSNAYPTE